MTLAEALVPASDRAGLSSGARALVLVTAGAALTALAAQLSFSVPWTPVPYTGQTAAVLLVGTVLGWRLGAASMLLYVLAGIAGAPIYAHGAHGVDELLGATGGYLVGFILAAMLVGRLAEGGWDRTPLQAAGLMLLGNLVIYAIGVPVLALALSLPAGDALQSGALVFLPWDAAKIALAAGLLPAAWRVVGRR
jgi:biotin transport system substrate-specific component